VSARGHWAEGVFIGDNGHTIHAQNLTHDESESPHTLIFFTKVDHTLKDGLAHYLFFT
jgi:hypothetical protein